MTPGSPVAVPSIVLSIPWPPSPEQQLSAQEQHYHKSLSCPHFEQLPPAPVSPGSPLQPVAEYGPPFTLHLPDPRTASGHTPFGDMEAELEDSAVLSSSPPVSSPLPPSPTAVRYTKTCHTCHTSPGSQQFMLSPPRNSGQRAAPVYTHHGSYQQQYMHRLRSAPLSSPPRKARPGSPPRGDNSEPSWLHHLRTLRTPVPWEDLGEAWAAASHADVQQQMLTDLPEDVQQDIRAREHQAKEQRERSLGARISRVLSRISLGGTSQQMSPVAGPSPHNTDEQHTVATSSAATSVGDAGSSTATSRQPSASLFALGLTTGTYDAGASGLFGPPPEDVAAAVLTAVNTAKGRVKPPPHRQSTAGSVGSSAAQQPQAQRGPWDLVQWMLGKLSTHHADQQTDAAGRHQLQQPQNLLKLQERPASGGPRVKSGPLPLSEQVLDQPYMIAASACL